MTIEDFLRMLLRNALLLIVVTIVGGAAGYGYSYTQPALYSASALGYVATGGTATSQEATGSEVMSASGTEAQYQRAQLYLPLFSTRVVGERIVEETGLDQDPNVVAGSVQATLDPNAPIITVTATAGSPEEAFDIANAAVDAVAAEAETIETGGDPEGTAAFSLVTYQTALLPGAPVSPDRERFAMLGAAAGLLLALALAFLRDRNDARIRTAEDITNGPELAVLGTLPELRDLARGKDGRLPEPKGFAGREALRKLRTNLRYIDVDAPPRSIVVTSSAPGEGKSTVSGNLARVMARAGQPTLLIDADLRRPVVAAEFGVDGEVGLSQLLAGSVDLVDAVQPSGTEGLFLLPAGQVPPNPSELVGSRRMKELVAELSTEYFVIIDAPPVLAVTDSQLLSRHADGAILVAVPGATRTLSVERAVETLRSVGAKVYGAVLNRASTSRFTRIAYGDAEYGYGAYGRYGGRYRYSGNYAKLVAPAQGEEVDVSRAGGVADAHGGRTTSAASPGEEDGSGRRRATDPQEPR